jgi:hypothetical protein
MAPTEGRTSFGQSTAWVVVLVSIQCFGLGVAQQIMMGGATWA